MNKRIYTAKDFPVGNFIKEVKPYIVQSKSRKRTYRQGLFTCTHCKQQFIALISNVLKNQGKYCSRRCALVATRSTVIGGNENHPLYSRWLCMTQRCTTKTSNNYKNYGERGISIEPYLQEFANYVEYVTSLEGYSEKHLNSIQLDRIDNNGNYCRGNLRWVNRSANLANTRKRSNSKHSIYKGITYSKIHNKWVARVVFQGKHLFARTFDTELEALIARDDFIIQNKLPHTLNLKERATTIPTGSTLK